MRVEEGKPADYLISEKNVRKGAGDEYLGFRFLGCLEMVVWVRLQVQGRKMKLWTF